MKILIVVPRHFENPDRSYPFPLGAATVHAMLVSKGHDVDVLDLNRSPGTPAQLVGDRVSASDYRVVMAGGLTQELKKLRQVFQAAKQANPTVVTVGGGGGFTAAPALFGKLTGVDYACVGEAEHIACDLVEALAGGRPVQQVRGLVVRDGNSWHTTPAAPQIADLDTLPLVDYEAFGVEEYLQRQYPNDFYPMYVEDRPGNLPMTLGRSCPYKCTFCFHPASGAYRQRSLDHFFADLDRLLERYPIRTLSIYDELFASSPRKLKAFCERIRPYRLKWVVQVRVDIMTPEMLELLRASGCFYVSYGLESMSARILDSMRKRITPDQIAHALKMTYDAGIGIQGNFIFGDPAETWDTFNETLEWWSRHRHYQINLGMIMPLPGTVLFRDAVSQGRIPDAAAYIEAGCPPVNMTALPDSEYEKMRAIIKALQKDNPYTGEILRLEPVEGNVYSADLRCSHCRAVHTLGRLYLAPGQETTRQRIGCRQCNARSAYLFEPRKQAAATVLAH